MANSWGSGGIPIDASTLDLGLSIGAFEGGWQDAFAENTCSLNGNMRVALGLMVVST